MNGILISLEGPDGAGKTTVLNILQPLMTSPLNLYSPEVARNFA